MAMITEEFRLLGEHFSTRNTPYRPPWAVAERPFVMTCDRCGDCIDACPEHVLVYGRGNLPEIDFDKGGCSFCGKCTQACEPGGLRAPDNHPWRLRAFINKACLANQGTQCTDCGEACPAHAIIFRRQVDGSTVPIIEEMFCTGCGSCVSACPTSAVKVFRLE